MNKKRNDLKNSVEWINGLEEKRRKRILNLINLEGTFRLQGIEILNIKVFVNFITKEFENGIDENNIISKLLKAGIDKECANILVEYSQSMMLETQGIRIVKDMSIENFEEVLIFILNKIHLYREINFIPFEEFTESLKFKNEVEAKLVLRLINTYFNRIKSREMTIENVRDIFIKIHELDISYVNLFANIIKENLDELRNAYIVFTMNRMQDFMDNFEEDDDYEEDGEQEDDDEKLHE